MQVTTQLINVALTQPLTTGVSPAIDIQKFLFADIQVIFAVGNAVGTLTIETSNDNVNFDMWPGSGIAFNAASSTSHKWTLSLTSGKYVRVAVTNSSGTTGTIKILFLGKTFI